MEGYGFLSVVPAIIAIALALYTKDVIRSLFLGCFSAFLILSGGNVISAIADTLMSFIKVFESNGNTIVIGVTLFIGGLLTVMEKSGGVAGFVQILTSKKSLIQSKRAAELFSWFIGVVVFTSGTVSALVTGTVSKPITDAYKVPHEKLAFIVHTTTAPVCALIPLSAWGAYMIGLIQPQGIADAATMMVRSIPLNFYCIIAVLMVPFLAITGKDYGPMKKAEVRALKTGLLDEPRAVGNPEQEIQQAETTATYNTAGATSAWNLVLPMVAMVVMIIFGLLVTGNGDLLKGNGSKAILWGSLFSLFVALMMYLAQKIMTYQEFMDHFFQGASQLLPISFILIFAWSFGEVVKKLGTGQYLAGTFADIITPGLLPALVFIIGCIISFATGTSWGTMAVMFPIALPMAVATNAAIPIVIGAVVGGSLFGDHSSPISDTTIMSCFTSRCDIVDHIRTQLPYTLTAAGLTMCIYLLLAFI
jgi:Na+/H+ antiporter NhaC